MASARNEIDDRASMNEGMIEQRERMSEGAIKKRRQLYDFTAKNYLSIGLSSSFVFRIIFGFHSIHSLLFR